MQRISKELAQHPRIVSLDASDCELTDKSMEFICPLLPNSGSKIGDYKIIMIARISNPDQTMCKTMTKKR